MAEYDHEFFDRVTAMRADELASYLHSLSEAGRDAVMAAMLREFSDRVVKDHIAYLQLGLRL